MSKGQYKQPGLDRRHRDTSGEIRAKRADAMKLGLRAFDKISAVEGVHLTDRMRSDARALSEQRSGDFRKK